MRKHSPLIAALSVFMGLTQSHAIHAQDLSLKPWTVSSGTARVSLIELYSSEGCSSCPNADAWLSALRASPELWKSFVPIEFHVDYWNRLGWTDRFSRQEFTQRQRAYAARWGSSSVYTPGFVRNGEEWQRSADLSPTLDSTTGASNGVLQATQIGPRKFRVSFETTMASGDGWTFHGALLGNGLKSEVKSGENAGRILAHEFVVLALAEKTTDKIHTSKSVEIELEPRGNAQPKTWSAAFWVSKGNELQPLQAVGGDLK